MDDGTTGGSRFWPGGLPDPPQWWITLAWGVTAAGLLCAVLLWGWQSTVGLMVLVLTFTSLPVAAAWGGDAEHDLRQTAEVCVVLGLGATAAVGLVAAWGALGLLVLVVLAMALPHADPRPS